MEMPVINESPADIREMYVAHIALRREYSLLSNLVLAVENEDRERAEIVVGHVLFLNSVLHRHHQGEDRHLWPRISERGAKDVAPLMLTLESQHEGIDKTMAAVDAALTAWSQTAYHEQATELARTIDVLVAQLEEHLRLEERQALPLIEKHITASEWNRMTEEGGADTPPEELAIIFGMLMYEGDPAVLQDMLSHVPAEVAESLGEVAATAYAEYCQRIHGTPTPRRITAA
jgi:hemerythrin-like domain-containing protein